MHHWKRSLRERGQASIEFLILLPLLLAIILLIAYSGWWAYTRLSAQNFLYSNCTGISRMRGHQGGALRGYGAAEETRAAWQVQTIFNIVIVPDRLGARECRVLLRNTQGQNEYGNWIFQLLVQSNGFAPVPPFVSCDSGYCR